MRSPQADNLRAPLLPGKDTRAGLIAPLALAALVAVAGCGRQEAPDLVNGKRLFAGKGTCGSCHTLARANTKGTVGPNLDDAFATDKRDGLGQSSIEGLVLDQIAYPRRGGTMPAGLVKGQNARDVAAYVAYAAARAGQDTGALATAAQPAKGPPEFEPFLAESGKLAPDRMELAVGRDQRATGGERECGQQSRDELVRVLSERDVT